MSFSVVGYGTNCKGRIYFVRSSRALSGPDLRDALMHAIFATAWHVSSVPNSDGRELELSLLGLKKHISLRGRARFEIYIPAWIY